MSQRGIWLLWARSNNANIFALSSLYLCKNKKEPLEKRFLKEKVWKKF